MDEGRDGLGAAVSAGTLLALFLVWAALHDISRARESSLTFECAALAVGGAGFVSMYWIAARLPWPARKRWLVGFGLAIALFNLSALVAWLSPKYPGDASTGAWFLLVGLPLLGRMSFDLGRHTK